MEPLILLIMIADGMTCNVFTEMILYQTCRHTLVINKTKCDIFHTNTSSNDAQLLQEIVQPQTSYIIMTKSLFENIFPTLLTLFVGPWSDKHGRKPFLVLGCFVPTCKYTILSILSCFDVNPWMFLLSSIPSAFLDCGLVLATNCYVSDITEPDKRATRLTYLQLSAKIGLVIGLLIGPMIFEKIGYMFLFIIATILTSLALFYTIVLVPESHRHYCNTNRMCIRHVKCSITFLRYEDLAYVWANLFRSFSWYCTPFNPVSDVSIDPGKRFRQSVFIGNTR
ncbi:hypothetical protein KQX54_017810 [Cotesia glomerata]|uniref:Major facilitator superfamily (MFS) profile domain-containing protein n=1 Tax=Cotesia glomerata TaxID=32391 RepID=A0AAV7HY81_COTGL|nr:hypothetical protein KQX54_017810 [Cotesia glomerata]